MTAESRIRPAWFPTCKACTDAWRVVRRVRDSVPARVPVDRAMVVREDERLLLHVRCHGARETFDVSHVRDESHLAEIVMFQKGSK